MIRFRKVKHSGVRMMIRESVFMLYDALGENTRLKLHPSERSSAELVLQPRTLNFNGA